MKNFIVWLVVIVVIVIIGFAISNNDSTTGLEEGEPVRVGVIAPLSGDGAVYGEMALNVYNIAVDEINADGGINGSPIELVVEDGECSGEGAISAVQKLVNVDKVEVIIGGFCSAESLAALPVAEAGKVALMSPASSNPSLTGASDYFFRNFPSDSSQGKVLAQVAYHQGKRKAAFITEQTDYAVGIEKSFADEFTELGGEVVLEGYAPETTDFRTQLTKLSSTNPDVLFINTNTPSALASLAQQIPTFDFDVQLFTNDISVGASDVLFTYSNVFEGMIGAEFSATKNAKFTELAESYEARYGEEMPYQSYAQTGYDAVHIIKDAIASVGYDGTKIAEYGHNIRNFEGASGSITIGSDGDIVGGHSPVVVVGGKVEPYSR